MVSKMSEDGSRVRYQVGNFDCIFLSLELLCC